MKSKIRSVVIGLFALAVLQPTLQAGEFHFSAGLTYVNGVTKTVDKLQSLYESAGYTFDKTFVIPVGLSLDPYYEFDSGIGVGLDVGPAAIIAINQGGFSSSSASYSYIVPMGADVRYTFFRNKDISPYVRVGLRYPIVGGSNLDSSQVGPFGAVGVEFWRTESVGAEIEVGYDFSRVTVKGPIGNTGKADYPGLTASLFVRF